MKRSKKIIALILALCMCFGVATPVYAAEGRGGGSRWDWGSFWDWDKFWDWGNKEEEKEEIIPEESGIPELTLVEDESTVANGSMLRAATYAVDEPTAQAAETVKYFPITMYDYDQVKYNNVLRSQEFTKDLTQWNGMYMGNDQNKSYTYTDTVTYGGEVDGNTVHYEKVTALESGSQYVLVSACEGANKNAYNGIYVGVGLSGNDVISVTNKQNGTYGNPIAGAAVWTVTERTDGTYRFENGGRYLTISSSISISTSGSSRNITVSPYTGKNTDPDYKGTVVLHNGGSYMNKAGGFNHQVGTGFAVYGNSASDGNAFYLYKVVQGTKEVSGEVTKNLEYAPHNKWTNYTAGTDGKLSGNRIYQGLVQNALDANGDIQFNQLDAGLFTETPGDGKTVYTKVGLPFEYDSKHQRYSFNAKEMGAWFGGAPASNVNLTYSEDPQARIGDQEDTNVAGWFPFDDSTDTPTTECVAPNLKGSEPVQAKSVGDNPNYYFGMAASIDFTMTPDGKLTDKNTGEKTPIDFHFSGDDDVWVFIDGKLVLDMGGIHNRINGDINFADGTWSINQTWGSTAQAEDINNGTANTSGNLWTTLGTDLTTFAAQETHTLSVFYLERGAGASNCEISFNLPMKDYVNVTKNATKDSLGESLKVNEQEAVNNMDFTYTIYRNGEPYANQVYTLLNATTGNAVGTAYTNASGQFTIKNNQTARFTTSFSAKGEIWYVEEMDPGAAFVNEETKWSSTSVTINGEQKGNNKGLASNSVEVVGSEEASAKIDFLCENILDAKLANPGIVPADDRIVIDYGLPVQIDVKKNDLHRADSYEVVGINGTVAADGKSYTDGANTNGVYTTEFGNVKITDAANGQLEYQLTKQLTDVEEITYIVKVSSTVLSHPDIEGSTETHTETVYASAKVYVIPATSMYYEENFKNAAGMDMITYKTEWETKGTANGKYQEPGVVKTTTDSPYGSDVAYLNDTGDSNGTSRYVSTANTANAFKYTFTGTGTSFFARTTNNSGYLRVTVTDSANEVVEQVVIDTRFLNDAGKTLYNIPVYTKDDLDYGTYTVTVNIAKNSSYTSYGTDFWLDGIRVQNPMNPKSEKYDIAQTAYSDDGEANVNIKTLRDKLIKASGFDDDGNLVWEDGFAVLTDINGNITSAADYESIGPKQEVYLAGNASDVTNGQKISFTLADWDMDHKLYLGLKAPMGTATVKINGKELTVRNTPDCYYNLTDGGYITVDKDGNAKIEIQAVSGVVSVTNIKTTGAVRFEIIPGKDIEVSN